MTAFRWARWLGGAAATMVVLDLVVLVALVKFSRHWPHTPLVVTVLLIAEKLAILVLLAAAAVSLVLRYRMRAGRER